MKRLLIPLIAALALPTSVKANWFGKYNSKAEAKSACFQWVNKEKRKFYGTYSLEYANKNYSKLKRKIEKMENNSERQILKLNLENYVRQLPTSRYCILESETRQILGYELQGIRPEIIYYEYDKKPPRKIVENFKY